MSVQATAAGAAPWRRLVAGGTEGNALLTAVTGAVLLGLLAVEGLTIVLLGQLLWVHLFVGLVLIPPTLLKLASTGYRFVRYYAGTRRYRRRGPPHTLLRATAPLLVASTLAVLASGVILLLAGPAVRPTALPIHKLSFFAWLAAFGVHLLGHLPGLPRALRGAHAAPTAAPRAGAAGRRLALAAALATGVVLALVLIPDFAAWLDFRHIRGRH
jgi:hypothetical protein